jgi:hypothetical protein
MFRVFSDSVSDTRPPAGQVPERVAVAAGDTPDFGDDRAREQQLIDSDGATPPTFSGLTVPA